MVDQGGGRKVEGRINWRADVVFLAGEGFKLFQCSIINARGIFFSRFGFLRGDRTRVCSEINCQTGERDKSLFKTAFNKSDP